MIIESGNKYVLAELTVPGYNTDRGSLKALAADRGITEAEAYIVSELNVNLYKRFLELIKTIKIKTVYVPHPESIEEIESLAHIGKYCNNNHIELEKYRVGDNIDIFGGKDGIKMLESENGSASVCEVALAGKKIIYSRAKEKGELLTLNSECFAFIECGKGVPVIGAEGKTHFCAYDPLNANIGAPQPKGCECADMSKIKYIYLDLTSGEIKVSK
ncbi:hypothetical protein SDC9_154220 [bioreactor metagenome]|uniref:Uncharacterized protein n=1 Tax=bioreactor metagenome TaxID=1076179 RepID=A0A645F2T3_9ZZZZ